MKKSILFILFFMCFMAMLFAQKREPDTLLFEVYFAPAKFSLNEEAKNTLNMVSYILADGSHATLNLKGSCENLGDNKRNKQLSMERCEMVKQYLLLLGVEKPFFSEEYEIKEFDFSQKSVPKNSLENRKVAIWAIVFHEEKKKQEEEIPTEQVELSASFEAETPKIESVPETEVLKVSEETLNVAAVAEESREVLVPVPSNEIDINLLSEKTDILKDIYAEMRQNKKQSFRFNAQTETQITLKSGNILYVPENTFEIEDATNQTVEIQVEEYFHKSDILLAGLSTTSHGKLLETSGMFYISAFSGGKELALSPNKYLRIGLINKEEVDMWGITTFEGVTDSSGSITDWKELGNPSSYPIIKNLFCFCELAPPDSISKKLKVEVAEVCKVCSDRYEKSKFFGRYTLQKISAKEKDAVFKKYEVKNCDELHLKLSQELRQANAASWIQSLLKAYLQTTNFYKEEEFSPYFLTQVKLKWVNGDRYWEEKDEKLMAVKMEEGFPRDKTIAFLVMRKEKVIVPLEAAVPRGKQVYIVGIQKTETQFLLSITAEKTDDSPKNWNWKTVSKAELLADLKKIDN